MTVTDPEVNLTLTQALISLMPVIVGGLIAISGGLRGSFLSHSLKKSSDQRERRRTKLEEIVSLTFEVEQWLEQQKDYYFWGKQIIIEASPLDKCRSMTNLYFPELRDPMLNFWNTAISLNQWVIGGGQERVKTGKVSETHIHSYPQVYKPFHESHLAFIDHAAKIMRGLS